MPVVQDGKALASSRAFFIGGSSVIQRIWKWFFSRGKGIGEFANRLGMDPREIIAVDRSYREFQIRKRSGAFRKIAAPNPDLKRLQRRILKRLLARLKTHPCATGFQPGVSFVDNARCHQSQRIVIKVDLVNFFPSIDRDRIEAYFRRIGWNRKAAQLLTELTTFQGALPQGAPTSPRLSNLVNYRMDTQLAVLAEAHQGIFTRYADDITISLSDEQYEVHRTVQSILRIVRQSGYRPHVGRKFDVRRSHQRQVVTGLVVNDRANLPRETRRWLRAVEYRIKNTSEFGGLQKPPTLSEEQLRGWKNLQRMINRSR